MDLISNETPLEGNLKHNADESNASTGSEMIDNQAVVKQLKYERLEDSNRSSIAITCVDPGYEEMGIEAYRWTFEEINDERNFLPRALLLPRDNARWQETAASCGGWSLSFFTTELSAINRLNKICQCKPKLYLKLGTHVAKGSIEEKDGKCGDFNDDGHFEHFEYRDTDFSVKFQIIRKVV